MKVAFVGSREYPNLDLVRTHIRKLHEKYPEAVLVSGGCRGVDATAEDEARKVGMSYISYRPLRVAELDDGKVRIPRHFTIECIRWNADLSLPYGGMSERTVDSARQFPDNGERKDYAKPAFWRNGLIAAEADVVMAYPCVQSNGHLGGTGDTMKKAEAYGRPVHSYPLPNPKK